VTIAEQLKSRRDQRLKTCKHFSGVQHKACKAGIKYADVEAAAPPLTGRHLPCLPNLKSGACEGECAKREFPTPEEVEAREQEIIRSISRTGTAIAAVVEKIGKWKKGMGDAQGQMPCPVCKTGTLGYSRSGYNGHIWGACSSPDCVRWMQ
jgi:hypothetical protein